MCRRQCRLAQAVAGGDGRRQRREETMTINVTMRGLLRRAAALALAVSSGAWLSTASAAGVDQKLHDAVPAGYQTSGVNIAVFNDWPPDEFVENGELKGWSVDMAKAMAEKLGIT